jgi:glycosyltransferase involved in cell wall biosynthesis
MNKIGEIRPPGVSLVLDVSPLLIRSAGVKNYTYYWARALAAQAGGNRLSLFPFLNGLGNFAHETSVLSPVATWPRLALLFAANRCPFPLLDRLAGGCDIFHASHLTLNPPRKVRLTSTVFDLTSWLLPELQTPANVKATGRIADRIFQPAAGLIAISNSTRDDAVRVLSLRPEKIDVIYPGIAPAFFEVTADEARSTASRYGLTKPYALYVGTIEPRKNVAELLAAWQALQPDLRAEFDLVVAGPWGWGDRAVYERLRSGVPGVRYLGYVPEADLPGLTAAAAVFVYVSLYEGFGLPVGQALAAGVPVITSNVSALPEVVGGAGVLVDPRSQSEIRGALERLLASPSLRAELSERGRRRAREFTWEECGRKSWIFFERLK